MKMSKRIFVCLIALAIGVSLLVCGVSAEGTAELKYTTENHASILEYYEEPIIFDLDFDGETTVASGYTHAQLVNVKNAANGTVKNVASIVEAEGGKYLSIAGGKNAMGTNASFLNWNAAAGNEIDDFIIEFDVMASGEGNRTVEVYVDSSSVDTAGAIAVPAPGTSVLKIDFSAGKLTYFAGVENDVKKFTDVEAELAADTFYHVRLVYGVGVGTVSAELTLGDTLVASFADGAVPTDVIANIRVGSTLANMQKSTIALDNVVSAGGSFTRSDEDKVPETERAIADFIAICQDPDIPVDDKISVVNTGLRLITVHNVEGKDDTAKANLLAFQQAGVRIFYEQIAECVLSAPEIVDYDERVAYVEGYERFVDLIPEDIDFMGEEKAAVEAAVSAYYSEVAALEAFKIDSEAVLSALADVELSNTNLKDYGYLKSYYDAIVDHTPYVGYPGVPEILDAYNTVVARFTLMAQTGKTFTDNVATAADTANSFGVRFTAYCAARDNYFDDPAYPDIAAALASYASVDAEMVAVIEFCDTFILNVNRADYSQYLSAKKLALAAAGATIDAVKASYLEYPGITEAIELYDALYVEINNSEAAAKAYVDFVVELGKNASSMTKAELQAAILEALELQLTGNVIGYEAEIDGEKITVTDANIILNNLQSDLELTVGYREQFTAIVNSIEKETVASNVYALAYDALEAYENASRFEGVDEADKAKLDAKIAELNAKIQALNEGFAQANEVACNTVSASSGSAADNNSVGKVVALIKKFYE